MVRFSFCRLGLGAGERVSTGGPAKGYYSVGLGAQYSPTSKYFISGGMKYLWLGDAKGQLGAQAGSEYYVGEYKITIQSVTV